MEEKEEVYYVFYRPGSRMGVKDLQLTYPEWLPVRETHLMEDRQKTEFSIDPFRQYKKHLGATRFRVLIKAQKSVIPVRVKELLNMISHF